MFMHRIHFRVCLDSRTFPLGKGVFPGDQVPTQLVKRIIFQLELSDQFWGIQSH